MNTKIVFVLLGILAIILSSCGPAPAVPAVPTTPTLLPTQQTVIPTDYITIGYPTWTPAPLATAIIQPTWTPIPTNIPYPTASVVKSNAVAFIAENSLWIANVDGSGERKLADIIQKGSLTYDLMRWSPNGEWISYRSNGELWMVSRDGSIKRNLLSFPDKNTGTFYVYAWAPDSSKIAYENLVWYDEHKNTPTPGPESWRTPVAIGIIDLVTGEISELSVHDSNIPWPLSWSPNGRYILFTKELSYVVYDVAARKITKKIQGCWQRWDTWSPNSEWFFDNYGGNFPGQLICVGGLDGSNHKVDVGGTTYMPVWDKTGNSMYLAARINNPNNNPNIDTDHILVRYDVRTQKTKKIFSLKEKSSNYHYFWTVSISPDGRTLEMDSTTSENQQSYIFINLETLTATRFEVSNIPDTHFFNSITYWSADSQNIILLSQSNGCFYKLDIQTGKTTIISGSHSVENWAVSPIATTP